MKAEISLIFDVHNFNAIYVMCISLWSFPCLDTQELNQITWKNKTNELVLVRTACSCIESSSKLGVHIRNARKYSNCFDNFHAHSYQISVDVRSFIASITSFWSWCKLVCISSPILSDSFLYILVKFTNEKLKIVSGAETPKVIILVIFPKLQHFLSIISQKY